MVLEQTFPLVILGGRDHKSTVLPEDGRDKHLLAGFKAVEIQIGGRPIILHLIERLQACGAFDPIYIAGPAEVYEPLETGARIIETDGTFGENLAACVRALIAQEPGRQAMFTTCDIVPDAEDLRRALADLRRHQPIDYWMPQIRVPADLEKLGESSWKPKYQFRPEGESEPARVLPGHFIAVDPQIAYVELIVRFFDALYSTRNTPIAARYASVTRAVMAQLVMDDLRDLLHLGLPTNTFRVVYNCLVVAKKLAAGTVSQTELEDRLRKIFIRKSHQKKHPRRRSRVAVLEGLSLAKDVDTEEEAAEMSKLEGSPDSGRT